MGLKGQAQSHIELVKTIAAVVAFESVKMNREERESNLSEYRVPINIEEFKNIFVSNSYEARRAMNKMLKYYETRKERKVLFNLDGTDHSYADFATAVGKETRSAHVWVSTVNELIKKEKEVLVKDIKLKEA